MAQGRPTQPPPIAPFSWSRTITIFVFLLTFMIILDPNLSRGLGMMTAAALNPLFGFGGMFPVLTIFCAAVLTTGVSTIVRHYFSDWVKMAKMQKQNSALQKATMEAMRRRNLDKVQRLRQQGAQIRADNMSVQFAPMKSMVFTFLLFILVFAWLSSFIDSTVKVKGLTLFAVPWQYQTDLSASYVFAAWLLLYMLFNIFLSQLFSRILKFFSFRKKLAEMKRGSSVIKVSS